MGNAVTAPVAKKPWYRQLYVWVLFSIVLGALVGFLWPSVGAGLQPISTTFVSAIQMVITPIIFLTVVAGIGGIADLSKVGRIGGKALIYFEVVSTFALIIGLIVVNVLKPGQGMNVDASKLKVSETAATYISQGTSSSPWHYLTDIVPTSAVGAFASGNVLQVLFFAILFGVAVKLLGKVGEPITAGVNRLSAIFFKILSIIMYAAPVGAFAAMAFTVGKYGVHTLTSLGKLVAGFYATSILFVVVVLGTVAWANRFNIFSLLRYLKEELLIVLGTSSSETVLPRLLTKMERAGAPKEVVGLTIPAGYSFNLDGTAIYMTMGAMFVAQATNTHMTLGHQIVLVLVLLLTSKGAAGVTGSGFIVLAATLSTIGHVPVAGIMLIFGVDRFMSECRAITNTIGNSVATLVVANWEGTLDRDKMKAAFSNPDGVQDTVPEIEKIPSNA
jgi:aerobic C4-dicarboxylate transport protein